MNNTMKINKWAIRGRILWLYIKYQVVTKALLGILVLPIFSWFTNMLIHLSGRTNISSGDFKSFFFSIYGIPVILLGILLLILVVGIDMNTIIIISALVEEGKLRIKMKSVLTAAIKSLKNFFSPLGILLVIYASLVLPLVGVGVKLGPLKSFKIPNFITSVIFNNTFYTVLYAVTLTLLFLVSIIYIFSIHFILIGGEKPLKAFKSSRILMKKYWKKFIVDYFLKLIKIFILFASITITFVGFLLLLDFIFNGKLINDDVSIILLLLSVMEIIALFGLFFVPIAISLLTKLYYKYHKEEGKKAAIKIVKNAKELEDKDLYRKIRTTIKIEVVILLLVILIGNFALAKLMDVYFDDFFKSKINVELVAHRGGGDLGAENTLQGIEVAIEENVSWTEIDVQRTKDGEYIINHDANFKRVAGVAKTPMEMTLEEIKELKVKNEFDPSKPFEEVPTLEELLDTCKGKIGVFVELKGKSADEQMVDEVVKLIEDKGMLDECVILSLDYPIIEYTHDNYPQIKTGFLYYFSVGDLKNLKGDYLIMEEREATTDKINEIHATGKKAVVWTVNTPDSIEKFIRSDVDGIITDYIPALKEAIEKANQRSHLEIILDSFKY